jgi:probable phosphomutase (TIGR03848 family)
MTTLLLIRHASHDLLGKALAGRAPDLHLNARGKMEAERLAERLAPLPIRAIYTSPMERAQETAWPLANRLMLEARIDSAVDEIDFGDWTSRTFAELDPRPDWQTWNAARARGQVPGGESMSAVQTRIVDALAKLEEAHRAATVAVVSHGDVIKAALLHYLGVPLDHILRLEISPASVSIVALHGGAPQVTLVNDTGLLVDPTVR